MAAQGSCQVTVVQNGRTFWKGSLFLPLETGCRRKRQATQQIWGYTQGKNGKAQAGAATGSSQAEKANLHSKVGQHSGSLGKAEEDLEILSYLETYSRN